MEYYKCAISLITKYSGKLTIVNITSICDSKDTTYYYSKKNSTGN